MTCWPGRRGQYVLANDTFERIGLGHSPSKIVIQPVGKIIYDPNPSTRLTNYKET